MTDPLVIAQLEILKAQIAEFEATISVDSPSWNPSRVYKRVRETQAIVDSAKALFSITKRMQVEQ
jgi:hypothetical protein